jgi:integrase
VATNPVKDVEIPEAAGGSPGILTVEQCRALLETARTRFPEFVPYITLGLFCGLRPEAELARLEWSDVQIDRERVHIPIAKTKISLPRNVSLSANAVEWLMLCRKREGHILPPCFGTRWNHLRWLAGFRTRHRPTIEERAMLKPEGVFADRKFAEWPADGMRHTFATNHLAFHHNAPLTSAQMGHLRASTIVMYCGLEPQTDPAAFWRVRPQGPICFSADNVVPMVAVG